MKTRMLVFVAVSLLCAAGCARNPICPLVQPCWYTRFPGLEGVTSEERLVSYGAISCNYTLTLDQWEHRCEMAMDSAHMKAVVMLFEFDLVDSSLNVAWRGGTSAVVGPGEKKKLVMGVPTGLFPGTTLRIRVSKRAPA